MNGTRTSLKKYKNILLFLSIIFFIGVISGFIYFNKIEDVIFVNLQENLVNVDFNSNIIFHLLFLAIILFFSLLIIGFVIGLFFYFYEALSIGFICGAFLSNLGTSGLIYSIFYILIFKVIYILFLTLILIKSFNVTRNIIGYLIFKSKVDLKNLAIKNFIAILKYSVIILFYDLFLTFFGNNILSIFRFLI